MDSPDMEASLERLGARGWRGAHAGLSMIRATMSASCGHGSAAPISERADVGIGRQMEIAAAVRRRLEIRLVGVGPRGSLLAAADLDRRLPAVITRNGTVAVKYGEISRTRRGARSQHVAAPIVVLLWARNT